MKITIKTLQQKIFYLDAEGSDTIGDLKRKVQEQQGHPVANQKIIYSGSVLSDDKTVDSCKIKEKDFLVLMVSKPKAEPKPEVKPTEPAASTSAAPVNPPAPVAAPAAPAESSAPVAAAPQPPNAPILTPAQAAPVAATQERALNDENAFVTGAELQATVANMMEMGFERDQVMRALRASYNNPDRAVEYLFSGIPSHLEEVAQGGPPAAAPGIPAAGNAPAAAPAPIPVAQLPQAPPPANQNQNLFQLAQQQQAQQPPAAQRQAGQPQQLAIPVGPGGNIDVAAIQNQPQIQHLRQLMQQNPGLIQPIIQELATQNPQLTQLFAQNPAALAQIFGVPPEQLDLLEGLADELPQQVIEITPEERAAIQRLEDLGFPRQAAIEAYFACDKNEEMAANYLFESNFE